MQNTKDHGTKTLQNIIWISYKVFKCYTKYILHKYIYIYTHTHTHTYTYIYSR